MALLVDWHVSIRSRPEGREIRMALLALRTRLDAGRFNPLSPRRTRDTRGASSLSYGYLIKYHVSIRSRPEGREILGVARLCQAVRVSLHVSIRSRPEGREIPSPPKVRHRPWPRFQSALAPKDERYQVAILPRFQLAPKDESQSPTTVAPRKTVSIRSRPEGREIHGGDEAYARASR